MTKNETAASMGVEGVTIGPAFARFVYGKGFGSCRRGELRVVLRPLEQRVDLLYPSRKLLAE